MKTKLKLIQLLLLPLAISLAFSSCEQKKDKTVVEVQEDITPEELKKTIDSLESNMTIKWDTLISNDDIKTSSLRRLIEELGYIKGSHEDSLSQLTSALQAMKESRYTQTNLNNERIDNYDKTQEQVINRVFNYASTIPAVKSYPMIKELQNDIMNLDQQVVFLRSGYDEYALELNRILETYPNTLQKLDSEYATKKPVGVFSIIEEVQ